MTAIFKMIKSHIKADVSILPVIGFAGLACVGGTLFMGYSMLQMRRPELIENNSMLVKIRHMKMTDEERKAMKSHQQQLEDLRNDLGFTYTLPK